jgi:hypothetical protein
MVTGVFCIVVKGTSPEYRPKHDDENTVNEICHKYLSAFIGYLCIMITVFTSVSNNNQICYTRCPRITNKISSKHLALIRVVRQWKIRNDLIRLRFK